MTERPPERLIEGVRLGKHAQDRRPELDEKKSYWERVKRLAKEEKRA